MNKNLIIAILLKENNQSKKKNCHKQLRENTPGHIAPFQADGRFGSGANAASLKMPFQLGADKFNFPDAIGDFFASPSTPFTHFYTPAGRKYQSPPI